MNTERLEALAKLTTEGLLKAPRVHRFPLDQAAEAIKLLGHSDGKIVVTI
jgi:NADPH:quinone reductase-like Zn-dependent oxidoreductase